MPAPAAATATDPPPSPPRPNWGPRPVRPDTVRTVPQPRSNLAIIDPGWLFLAAGLALLAACILIPASARLDHARYLRDRAVAIEEHRLERIARYEEYLAALERREPTLVIALVASQLNKLPADRMALPGSTPASALDASVFPALEPPALQLPEYQPVETRLSKLVTGEKTRRWVLIGGALLILIGLLPAATPRSASQSQAGA